MNLKVHDNNKFMKSILLCHKYIPYLYRDLILYNILFKMINIDI